MSGVNITEIPKPIDDVFEKPEFDFSGGDPIQFPIHVFPPLLRSVAEEMAEVYQTPKCLPAMTALAVLSGAVGRSVHVSGAFRDKETRLNLYVIPVAERGSGKGNIGEKLCEPLARRSQELEEKHQRAVAGNRGEIGMLKAQIRSIEGGAAKNTGSAERANETDTLSNRYQRLAELEAEAAREKTLLIGDTTSEALACALVDNDETLFSFSSEAGDAVQVALGKYSQQADFGQLLSGYSGDAVRTKRITRKTVSLKNPCLSLLWLVQGCVIKQLVSSPEALGRGLTARILIFDTGARREHDNRLNLKFTQGDEWSTLVNDVLDRRLKDDSPVEIKSSPEAREVFAKFWDESVNVEHEYFPDLEGELSRWRENAIKVGGLFAVAEEAETITADLAERAVAVVRWCMINYLGLLQAGRRERLQEKLDRVLELISENNGKINLGPLAASHKIKRPEIQSLVAAFPDCLEIVRTPPTGPGRPQEFVQACSKSSLSS